MTFQYWGQAITDSLVDLWLRFINFLPSLFGALLVFVIGWFIAVALEKFVAQLIKALRIDHALDNLGLKSALEKANIKGTASEFIGALVKWFLVIAFLMAASDILGLNQVGNFLNSVLFYIPSLVIAVIIILVAVLLARFVENVIKASVRTAGFTHGNFPAAIAKWAILIFAVLAALEQLGIAPSLIRTLFTGVVALIAVAGGLAFGLGGKDLASEFLNKIRQEIKDSHNGK